MQTFDGLALQPLGPLGMPKAPVSTNSSSTTNSTNLASQDVSGFVTALPMWAVACNGCSGSSTNSSSNSSGASNSTVTLGPWAHIRLDNVTIMLPQSDFQWVLATALRVQRNGSLAAAPWPLSQLITDFVTDPLVPSNRSRVVLRSYAGLGINATRLVFLPEAPLPPTFQPTELDPEAVEEEPEEHGEHGHGLSSKEKAIALGVGLGLGIPSLLAMAVACTGAAMMVLRWRKRG